MSTSAPAPPRASALRLREEVRAPDEAAVVRIVEETGRFSPPEVEIAAELVREALRGGAASGYRFVFAERADRMVGYACFGEIPLTRGSWDLYWIAVSPRCQRDGVGARLLGVVEQRVGAAGGRRLYVDTSGRPDYAPAHAFYARAGYAAAARLEAFYGPGDDKLVYVKVLRGDG